MLTIESRTVNNFWACYPISSIHMMCLVSILRSTSNHIPQYRCSTKKINRICPDKPLHLAKETASHNTVHFRLLALICTNWTNMRKTIEPLASSSVIVFWRFHPSHASFIQCLSRTGTFNMWRVACFSGIFYSILDKDLGFILNFKIWLMWKTSATDSPDLLYTTTF